MTPIYKETKCEMIDLKDYSSYIEHNKVKNKINDFLSKTNVYFVSSNTIISNNDAYVLIYYTEK